MEAATLVDMEKENHNVAGGNKMKGHRATKGSSPTFGNPPLKRLADISNLSRGNHVAKPQSVALDTKDYLDKLHQENMTLVKLLADRNKIIELSAIELKKLRINYQKVQQQNLQLAQANSQLLAELNSGKDKLKVLQHELGCKNGLLKARELESKATIKEAKKLRCQFDGSDVSDQAHSGETVKGNDVEKFHQAGKGKNKPCNPKRIRQSKVQALDPSTSSVLDEEKVVEKRACLKRRSSRFISGEQEPTEELFDTSGPPMIEPVGAAKNVDYKRHLPRRQSARFKSQGQGQGHEPNKDSSQIDDSKFSVSTLHEDPVHESCFTASSVKSESEAATTTASESEVKELRRASVRPMRRAVEKVQSYKEIPLNVKMRRAE